MTEEELVGWHHQLNRYEFEQTSGDVEGQGSLACCSPWGPGVLASWHAAVHLRAHVRSFASQVGLPAKILDPWYIGLSDK